MGMVTVVVPSMVVKAAWMKAAEVEVGTKMRSMLKEENRGKPKEKISEL